MKEIAIISKVVAVQSLMAYGHCLGHILEVSDGLSNTLEIAVLSFETHAPQSTEGTKPEDIIGSRFFMFMYMYG